MADRQRSWMDTDSDNDSSVIVDQDTSLVGLEQILLVAESDNLTTFESIDGLRFLPILLRNVSDVHTATILGPSCEGVLGAIRTEMDDNLRPARALDGMPRDPDNLRYRNHQSTAQKAKSRGTWRFHIASAQATTYA